MHLSSTEQSIFVAGHRGLVGSAVVEALQRRNHRNILMRTRDELDLLQRERVMDFFNDQRPQFVVLAAARVGGILANRDYPVDFLAENLRIQQNVIDAAYGSGVLRLVFLGSSCIYPKMAPQPMKEEHVLTGPLEPTNQWYAIAKITGLKLCQAYHEQHGADFMTLMPSNVYGPGDNFDLESSHVLAAMIRKFHQAKTTGSTVNLWGTGSPRREFLFSRDLAEACVTCLTAPESAIREVAPDGVLNAGVGHDISIRELAEQVQAAVDCDPEVVWDSSKPDGTPRKLLDVSRLGALGWRAETPLHEGLKEAYAWFLANEEVWL